MMSSLIGRYAPFARRQMLDVRHARAAIDFGAELARAGGHGVGHVGRRDVAVVHGAESGFDAEDVEEGMVLRDLRRADDLAFIAGQSRYSIDIFQPIDLFVGRRQP